eukprot:Nk52_evm22s233 gene=Nk52_evmTU22s233
MEPSSPHEETASGEKAHQFKSVGLLILLLLLLLTILTIWLFKRVRFKYIHETGASILYGIIAGAVIKFGLNPELHSVVAFNAKLFFYLLLPPIVFNAGFQMKIMTHFFHNFGAIVAYAFIGTIFQCIMTGILTFLVVLIFGRLIPVESLPLSLADCLGFGAMISATDTVAVLAIFEELKADIGLYAMVFGESALNDAVAIGLYNTVKDFKTSPSGVTFWNIFWAGIHFVSNFLAAFAIGVGIALVTSLFMKKSSIRRYPLLESTLFMLLSYSTFLISEFARFSGIVSVLFCGMTHARYTYVNMSLESRRRTKESISLMSFMAENFIFAYLGVTLFTSQKHQWRPVFIVMSLFITLLSRGCAILPISYVLNLTRKQDKIPQSHQMMMWWVGLRGAIAFALAMENTTSEGKQIIMTAALVIVIVTMLVFGGTTASMMEVLGIETGCEYPEDSLTLRDGGGFQRVRSSITEDSDFTDGHFDEDEEDDSEEFTGASMGGVHGTSDNVIEMTRLKTDQNGQKQPSSNRKSRSREHSVSAKRGNRKQGPGGSRGTGGGNSSSEQSFLDINQVHELATAALAKLDDEYVRPFFTRRSSDMTVESGGDNIEDESDPVNSSKGVANGKKGSKVNRQNTNEPNGKAGDQYDIEAGGEGENWVNEVNGPSAEQKIVRTERANSVNNRRKRGTKNGGSVDQSPNMNGNSTDNYELQILQSPASPRTPPQALPPPPAMSLATSRGTTPGSLMSATSQLSSENSGVSAASVYRERSPARSPSPLRSNMSSIPNGGRREKSE